jgi:short-subunit dehydrogenase
MGGVTLAGARVLLTGASGGIGAAISRRLAAVGADLVLSGRRADALDALAAALGARAVRADLAERDEVEALIAGAGEIDVLIACAALPGSGRLATLDQRSVDRALEVNLRAPIALARALAPGMVARRRGQLVFIGSLSGKAASAGASVYCATKFGLRGFALSLRAELAPSGVGVSIVEPGFVREEGMYAETGIALPRGIGTRRPADVAEAVARAIERDRGEVTVAPPAISLGAQVASIAPEFAAWASRRAGGDRLALQFEELQADKR